VATTNLQNGINEFIEGDSAVLVPNRDPTSYKEAMEFPDRELWKKTALEEWTSLLENGTFEAAPNAPLQPLTATSDQITSIPESLIPYGITPIGCK
jgi:hypothetical protein